MDDENKNTSSGKGTKIVMIIVVVLIVLFILGRMLLSMIPVVGGSFGYGFPGGSGGRAIRYVEIDVKPQVVYRIDEHRFFTFEEYKDCNSGGLVYYHDTRKKIKVFAGREGGDKKRQDEISLVRPNDTMSFYGRFVYAASDNIIAYPSRTVDYKYGGATYFIVYKNLIDPAKNTKLEVSSSSSRTTIITDDAIYIQAANSKDKYDKYAIPKQSDRSEWIDSSDVHFGTLSQDDQFHCNKFIKPNRVKFISN